MLKSVIKTIDAITFGGSISKFYNNSQRKYSQQEYFNDLNKGLNHRLVVHYKKNTSSLLSGLCDKYGSDKGAIAQFGHPYPWPSQTFADVYSRLFDHCRMGVKKVFECGLGTNDPNLVSSMGVNGVPGASLRVWRDYFPNSIIVGADIDKDILFEEKRIKTFYLDQTDPHAIANFWNNVGGTDFDFMIDDGLHTYEAGICLFENSVSKLSKNGIYSIEDVSMSGLIKFRDYFATKKYQVDYVNLLRPNLDIGDNNLVIIRQA
jgi:hypothetical protein